MSAHLGGEGEEALAGIGKAGGHHGPDHRGQGMVELGPDRGQADEDREVDALGHQRHQGVAAQLGAGPAPRISEGELSVPIGIVGFICICL